MYSRITPGIRPFLSCNLQSASKFGCRTLRGKRALPMESETKPETAKTTFPQSYRDLQRLSYQTTNPYTSPAPPLSISSGAGPSKAWIKKDPKKKGPKLEPIIPRKEKNFRPQRAFVPASELSKLDPENFDINKAVFVPVKNEAPGVELAEARPKLVFGISEENKQKWIKQLVTNLHRMPYPSQLKMKSEKNFKFLSHFSLILKNLKTNGVMINGKLPCTLSRVRPSPVTEEYRNKDEFTISYGVDGCTKTVGFYIGSYKETDKPFCVPPTEIQTIKSEHKEVAQMFEAYLQESPLEPCLSYDKGGHWRNLVVRSNQNGDLMAMAVLYPKGLTSDQLEEEKQRLRTFFSEGPGSQLELKSLYFQAKSFSNCTFKQCPAELLLGDPNLVETVAGLQVVVSPHTYLPINTAAAENLYDSLRELAIVSPTTTVIDLGCQSGALSLFLAKQAEKVIGIDNNISLVEEAKANANLNNIKNVEFLHGDLYDLLPYILDDTYSDDIVVVVHPSNSGLPKHILGLIRRKKDVRRVVYASSKPEVIINPNLIELCSPPDKKKELFGQPFVPAQAVQVDTLPHTYNCDLLILFERALSRHAKAHSFYKRPQ